MKTYKKFLSAILLFAISLCGPALAQLPPPTPMPPLPPPNPAFDKTTGNAATEVIIPTVAPVIFGYVSPSGGDAPLVLRITTMITNAWFDATAPYHETAVGVYTRLGRQPEPIDNSEMNVAILHASYHVLSSLLPAHQPAWDGMLEILGPNPDVETVDLTTPEGIGNAAGMGVVAGRVHDGMNQLGDEGDRDFNPMPYMDYTGYVPANTAYEFRRHNHWQPDLQRAGIGLYKVQQFVTPQWALTEAYTYDDPSHFDFQRPFDSDTSGPLYRQQADEVLAASANLTDEQKALSELFDNKIFGLGFSALFASQSRGHSLMEFVQLDFLTNMAAFDAGIAVWYAKREYDAVRPFSAIQYLYGDSPVTAWGGPGQGTVSDLPASQWKAYLEEADHPEYPSASTCFCHAHAESARRFFGDDALGWVVPTPAGSSRIEPGITPQSDIALAFPTWTEFAEDCGQSRVWAGVHFQAAVDESARVCPVFGEMAYDYFQSLMEGTAAERPPSDGMEVPWEWRH